MRSRRLLALLCALATVAAGLGVRAVGTGAFAEHAGDALYTVLLVTLVVAVAPRARPAVAAGLGLAASWAVELFQLTGVPAELSARSALARLVLGTSFNAPDLLWYAAGAGAAWAVMTLVRRPA
ncbi:hypothetical protein HNP84_008899 [Thermocatellispora tengchongensis]|uniref:DUF2809 domain-containing protein n=1 Tax=Thermocatellispora tengchongensis TaxID=1073253 RepID=A0A840PJQ5_9ACTN|nr:DUF2809 domain-containing protein [Thermocatellispora tengchongensis]MBB5139136.1 hypothetical protein [Thermocatellispora tengchongensis]